MQLIWILYRIYFTSFRWKKLIVVGAKIVIKQQKSASLMQHYRFPDSLLANLVSKYFGVAYSNISLDHF